MIKMTKRNIIAIAAVAVVLGLATGGYLLLKPRYAVDQDWYVQFAKDAKPYGDKVHPGFRMWIQASDRNNFYTSDPECNVALMLMNDTYGTINQLGGLLTFEHKIDNRKITPFHFALVRPKDVVWDTIVYERSCKEIESIHVASVATCAVDNKGVEECNAILSTMDEENKGLKDGVKLVLGF